MWTQRSPSSVKRSSRIRIPCPVGRLRRASRHLSGAPASRWSPATCAPATVGGPGARRNGSEADVPAECSSPIAAAWLSQEDEQPRREGRSEGPPSSGTTEVVGLIRRIQSSATFDRLSRCGDVVRHGSVELRYLLDGGDAPPRVAFAIGRRTGTAVVRNRLRRRLRAVMCELSESSRRPSFPSGDYLVRARASAAGASYAELRHDAERALQRVERRRGRE